jgi:hypothetical protein
MKTSIAALIHVCLISALLVPSAIGASAAFKDNIYNPGQLKPIDSKLKVKIGDPAPDFTLPSVSGEKITLSKYKGAKNVMISFVPAAWTPVCSDQWPGYNIVKEMFDENEAVLLGITPGPNRWVTCGSQFYRIFGLMERSLINTAFCAPMGFPKERCFLSIKKASFGISG